MDLLLDFNQQGGIWIDNNHKVFEKTEFENLAFRFLIKPLTRTELRKIRKNTQGSKGLDQDMIFPKIFQERVLDWELKAADGQMIPCTDENKKRISELFTNLSNLVAVACLDANINTSVIDEDELKNSLTSGSGD